MEKINKALGLKKTATEDEVVAAINEIQTSNNDAKVTIANLTKEVSNSQNQVTTLQTENGELKGTIDAKNNELAAAEEVVKELYGVIKDKDAQIAANANASEEQAAISREDAIKKAKQTMRDNDMQKGWVAEDGTVFYGEHEANLYAQTHKVAVIGEVGA